MPESPIGANSQVWESLDIFNPARLRTTEDIDRAVNLLEASLDDKSIRPIIQLSLQPAYHHAFEFIVSTVNDSCATRISNFILNNLPSNIENFYDSIGYETLSALSYTFQNLAFTACGKPDGLDNHLHHARTALTALEELKKLVRGEVAKREDISTKSSKKTPQRSMLSERSVDVESSIQHFKALGLQFPRSRLSAEETIQKVMDTLRKVLRFYIRTIRVPEIKRLIRGMYIDESRDIRTSSASDGFDGSRIKVDLHFPSAIGYGKWRLLCSNRCLRALSRNKDQADLALQKLQELSFGYFSETNQKRLTRDSPICIFQARLPGDLRIVYFVDVIVEFGADCESQVLKILGIYRLNELKRVNWDAVGNHQAREGKEYIDKCKARSSSDGRCFDPVTFTPSSQADDIFSAPDTHAGDIDEIRRMMDLEQFSILSENAVLNIAQGGDHSRIFQLSPEEQKVVECPTSSFVLGRSGTGKTTVIVFKIFGIERAWLSRGSVGPRPRQIYLTKSPLLVEKVEQEYLALWLDLGVGSDIPEYVSEHLERRDARKKTNAFLVDNSGCEREDLPTRFSELSDHHFPLFITIDSLCRLLAGDLLPDTSSTNRKSRGQEKSLWDSHKHYVTFDVFKREYWPHFRQDVIKGISPSLAFSSFLGIIKGSEESLAYPERILTREAYEKRRGVHVDYSVFEIYQKRKREQEGCDHADRVHELLNARKARGISGKAVDFIYVDEVQDLLMIDVLLVIPLCRNPNGFMWAGDTAQTISVESNFTFEQLGALVYRYHTSIQASNRPPRPSQPKKHQLLVNYRSHGGIVKCANAIIDLLQRFPGSIDILRPESGVVGRELPVFVHGALIPLDTRDFFCSRPGALALGSNQCIIVRDEFARQIFKRKVGNVGTILTLFGTKGLEFDDVLLYNFFEESINTNSWRHLTDSATMELNDMRHLPLIHELKYLYVAITRARKRLWIVDSSDMDHPLMQFLLKKGLVVLPSTSCNSIRSFAKPSDSRDWSSTGEQLMLHQEFEEARGAFNRAGDSKMAAVATACSLRQIAYDTLETGSRRDAFLKSAAQFQRCAREASSLEEQHSHYAAAAGCCAQAEYHRKAASFFKLAKIYTEAALYCSRNGLLDDAVTIIKKHGANVDPEAIKSIRQAARFEYLKEKRLEDAAGLFQDDEEMMAFAIEHDITAAYAPIFERQGKYRDLTRQHLKDGHPLKAIDVVLRHVDDTAWRTDLLNDITECLWPHLSFACRIWPKKAVMLPNKADTLPLAVSNDDEKCSTVEVFKLVLQRPKSPTFEKRLVQILHRHNLNNAIKLFSLDCLFDDIRIIARNSQQSEAVSILDLFRQYSLLMREAALERTPWEVPWLRALFQFKKDGLRINIRPGTFLSRGFEKSSTSSVSLLPSEFLSNMRRLLLDRLYSRTMKQDCVFASLTVFDSYIRFVPNDSENNQGDHLDSGPLAERWFNLRIRVHLQRIIIFDNVCSVKIPLDLVKHQRRLLHALGHALNPPLSLYHSISTLNGDLISDTLEGFSIAKWWALEALKTLALRRFGRRTLQSQGAFLAGSRVGVQLTNRWEESLDLEGLKAAIAEVTEIFGLLLDSSSPAAGWDGITLYRIQEDVVYPWPYS